MVREYKILNKDLPTETADQLAPFVIGPRVGKKAINAVYPGINYRPFRHRAWFYWNAMQLSGLAGEWDEVARRYNEGACVREVMLTLKRSATEEQWSTFSRRLGSSVPLPSRRFATKNGGRDVWTKGGNWQRRNNFTRIIILGLHIERDTGFSRVADRIRHDVCRKIETELHRTIEPDSAVVPEVRLQAAEYVRHRIGDLLYHKRLAGWELVSWFFQCRVFDNRGRRVTWNSTMRFQVYDPRSQW